MERSNIHKLHRVAGHVTATCTCCAARQTLVTQPGLAESRRACPVTGRTHVDRGDGLYEPDGACVTPDPPTVMDDEEIALLSDRPKRTGPKTRIELERATFAGRARHGEVARWNER